MLIDITLYLKAKWSTTENMYNRMSECLCLLPGAVLPLLRHQGAVFAHTDFILPSVAEMTFIPLKSFLVSVVSPIKHRKINV